MKIFIAMAATAATPKRRPAPKPLTSAQMREKEVKHTKALETRDKATMAAIKPLLPEGVKVRRVKFVHLRVPMSGIYVSGTSEKVQSLQFEVRDGKLSVFQCPINYLGNKYETWPVEGMEKIALTAANVKKALKKFGFI